MLLSNQVGCHVPVLKFGFPAAPDDENGETGIGFERHPRAGLVSAIVGRPLEVSGDSAGAQAFLVLSEPGLESQWQFN
ncbi:hypothetical protein ACWGH2_25575 [Streptomyces sp. NPDC054871]